MELQINIPISILNTIKFIQQLLFNKVILPLSQIDKSHIYIGRLQLFVIIHLAIGLVFICFYLVSGSHLA